jgi:large subunit ribosomal protein L32
MTTPTNKKSKAKTRARRANHDKVVLANPLLCDHCGADKRPHRVCPGCGHYKGRQIIEPKGSEPAPQLTP